MSFPWYELNELDYVMIGLVTLSALVSFFRGFVKEALSLTVWVLGFVLAFKFAPVLEKQIHGITHWGMLSYFAGFIIIFVGVWLIGLLVSLIIRSVVVRVGLGLGYRLLGVCFGVIRGLLIVSVLLMFINMSPYRNNNFVHSSKIAPSFQRIVANLDRFIPRNTQRVGHWAMGGNS